MLKIGLVGVGGISGAHIPAWNAMEDTTLTAICDIRPERMEPYPEPHHYTSIDEMLEKEELDILEYLPAHLSARSHCSQGNEKGHPRPQRETHFLKRRGHRAGIFHRKRKQRMLHDRTGSALLARI